MSSTLYSRPIDPIEDVTIKIRWEISHYCDKNHSYCYITDKSTPFAPAIADLKLIVDKLALVQHPMQIFILGGEPTLYPDLSDFLVYVLTTLSTAKVVLVTNGMQEVLYYQGLFTTLADFTDRFSIKISKHADTLITQVMDIVAEAEATGFTSYCDVMLTPSNFDAELLFYNQLKDAGFSNFSCVPCLLFSNSPDTPFEYTIEQNDQLTQIYQSFVPDIHYADDQVEGDFNRYYLIHTKMAQFRGMWCISNRLNYTISPNGILRMPNAFFVLGDVFTEDISAIINTRYTARPLVCNMNYCTSAYSVMCSKEATGEGTGIPYDVPQS